MVSSRLVTYIEKNRYSMHRMLFRFKSEKHIGSRICQWQPNGIDGGIIPLETYVHLFCFEKDHKQRFIERIFNYCPYVSSYCSMCGTGVSRTTPGMTTRLWRRIFSQALALCRITIVSCSHFIFEHPRIRSKMGWWVTIVPEEEHPRTLSEETFMPRENL